MASLHRPLDIDFENLAEAELVELARRGHRDAFRVIMQRCNQRLFRVARAIMRDELEAEDIVQEAYTRAFAKLDSFRGDSGILTWLTRIVINEARGRLRARRPMVDLDEMEAAQTGARIIPFPMTTETESPEASVARMQIRQLLEQAVDDLPPDFRIVFVLREIEELSVQETADHLDIRPETVKTRLHRARRLLRKSLDDKIGVGIKDAFPFMGARCQCMIDRMLARLPGLQDDAPQSPP